MTFLWSSGLQRALAVSPHQLCHLQETQLFSQAQASSTSPYCYHCWSSHSLFISNSLWFPLKLWLNSLHLLESFHRALHLDSTLLSPVAFMPWGTLADWQVCLEVWEVALVPMDLFLCVDPKEICHRRFHFSGADVFLIKADFSCPSWPTSSCLSKPQVSLHWCWFLVNHSWLLGHSMTSIHKFFTKVSSLIFIYLFTYLLFIYLSDT